MREVLTLQLGQTANYVGTHFWNTQEEYFSYGSGDNDSKPKDLDHDVLYRAGMTPTGIETYTPRVLVYDLKGAFGSLQKYNSLFSDTRDTSKNIAWDQGVDTVVSEPNAMNAYQQSLDSENAMDIDASYDLDTTVQNWSDYNRIFYHPRSMNQIMTHHAVDSIMPFDAYPVGRQSYKDFEKETETFDDNFRFFAEECDNLQGFQIFADIDDAFGGFTEGLLRDIKEEYPKTPIILYGLQSSKLPNKERARQVIAVNRGISMARLSDLSTLYIPLYTPSPLSLRSSELSPYILPNCNLMYHTSAIISAAIETVSLSFRIKNNAVSMADLAGKMTSQESTAIAGLSISSPLPVLRQGFEATLEQFKNNLVPLLDLTKSHPDKHVSDAFVEDVVVRGLPRATGHALFNYVQALYHKFPRAEPRLLDNIPYPLPSSYPKFFTPAVGADGLLSSQLRPALEAVQSIPLLTRMYTGPELRPELLQVIKQFENAPLRQLTEYSEGFTQADYLETKEDLWRLHDAFSE